jgi:hypothetical protein
MTKQEKIQYIEATLVEINKYIYQDEKYWRSRASFDGEKVAYKVETEVLEEAVDMLEMNNMAFEIPKVQHHAPAWTFIYLYTEAK